MSGEGMFKARILTSIGLIFGVFGLTYFASNLVVVAVFTGVLFLSGLEWAAMAGLQLFRTRLAFAVLLCVLSCFGIYGLSPGFDSAIQYWLGVYCRAVLGKYVNLDLLLPNGSSCCEESASIVLSGDACSSAVLFMHCFNLALGAHRVF
jgi:CDP-diglyceride synthetase